MPASTIPAEGTTLGYSATDSSYTTIGNIIAITPPGPSVPSVEKTKLTSTAKEFRPGKIPDFGEMSFRIQYDPNDTDHRALYALLATPVTKYWLITYNDGMAATSARDKFQGFITGFEPSELADESNVEADLTIKVTGVVTSTAGTAV